MFLCQGLSSEYDLKKIIKVAKKEFACNGTVVDHSEYGEVLQLQVPTSLPPAPCLQLPASWSYISLLLPPAPSLLPGRPEREHLQAAGDLWPGEAGPAQGPRLLGAQILRELLHTLVGLLVILCVSQETCSGQHFLVTLLWHFSKILKTLRGTF